MKTNLLRPALLTLSLGSSLLMSLDVFAVEGSWHVPHVKDIPNNALGESIRYGKALIDETANIMGPQAENAEMRFSGNNLNCQSCHLISGQKRYSAPFVGTIGEFPRFEKRENVVGTVEDRINGCMERSMNGKKLAIDSKEMTSMVAYMKWLSSGIAVGEEIEGRGLPKIEFPDRAADPKAGQAVYERQCQHCHGVNGEGTRRADSTDKGYLFPPLWGDDSYNVGAGMNRLLTAAQFIKSNMPFGATYENAILTDEEAYDVAAYISSKPRPDKADKENDFPIKGTKPIDKAYPPYDDQFTQEQHQYGPFKPIDDAKKAMKKKEAKK